MTKPNYGEWEPIIGLEIHVQLSTKTKLFSGAPNKFGSEPNTNISFVDTGLPGTLPVLNEEAVRKAAKFGCAVGAEVAPFSKFDRKSYFYPDSPRNFQITQFDMPIVKGGSVTANVDGVEKTFTLDRAHLEDDAGMLKHFSSFAGVDYNRAGVPLLEIVSEPCIFSAKEATAYAMTVKSIMEYLDCSDCNMEEGSLRMDVNVSVRKKGEKGFRNKIEIKNMNSFTNMEIAIEAEIKRQIKLYTENPDLVMESSTCRLDLEKKVTVVMRSKEDAKDYRYFPEPDLPPIILTKKYIDEIKASLPELPQQKYARYIKEFGLSEYNATILINDKSLCDYFEEALEFTKHPKLLCNWLTVEFIGRLKSFGKSPKEFGILAKDIGSLCNLIEKGTITGKIAKVVADAMVESPGKSPEKIISENPDLVPVTDLSEIEPIVDEVLKNNQQSVTDYRAGIGKAYNYLFGQVMKVSRGKASPQILKDVLQKKLESD